MRRYLVDTSYVVDALNAHEPMDLLIAATALEHSLVLVTNNIRDFRPIPDVELHEPA